MARKKDYESTREKIRERKRGGEKGESTRVRKRERKHVVKGRA